MLYACINNVCGATVAAWAMYIHMLLYPDSPATWPCHAHRNSFQRQFVLQYDESQGMCSTWLRVVGCHAAQTVQGPHRLCHGFSPLRGRKGSANTSRTLQSGSTHTGAISEPVLSERPRHEHLFNMNRVSISCASLSRNLCLIYAGNSMDAELP